MAGFFVSGTDTDVGKTFVGCTLARGLREAGFDLGVMKPAETGVPATGPLDAIALREAAGVDDPISLICPLQFDLPAAPLAAARAEGRDVPLAEIASAYQTLAARHAGMLVEGAGGLRVPLFEGFDMGDLARTLDLPILLVARASLGTINHTLLSVEACEQRGLPLLGVVISHANGALSDADAQNLTLLREALGDHLIGELIPTKDGDLPNPQAAGLDRVLAHLTA